MDIMCAHCHRILVIEDDAVQRLLIREILDDAIYQITEASCGQDGLLALQTQHWDAVLMDRRMPDMHGDTLCRHIRAMPHLNGVFVLMVTGDSLAQDIQTSLQAGASDVLHKPYRPSELKARLDEALAPQTSGDSQPDPP